jgi:ribosome biogenesis protein ERB1
VLSDEQVQKLEAIGNRRYPQIGLINLKNSRKINQNFKGYNPYQPFFDLFSSQREIHPISNRPPDKRYKHTYIFFKYNSTFFSSFIPSLDERRIVSRMVHAIKMGWMKRRDELEREQEERERAEENPPVF